MDRRRAVITPAAIATSSRHLFGFLVLVTLAGLGLSVVFWAPLYLGAGLIGGDLYPYYFPQKAFLSDSLRAGEFPLWNNWVGHGYPLIAESQTAALHPFVLVAFWQWDINTAYNAVQLFHYVLAFVGMALFTRRWLNHEQGAWFPALLSALVFTYGWFPPRICLEWAILTGAYLPWILWSTDRLLTSGRLRDFVLLSGLLAVQLLAGHFHIAFLTLLLAVPYAATYPWRARDLNRAAPQDVSRVVPWRSPALVLLAIAMGFLLAAVQLFPTWELKQQSQRAEVNADHDPAYGHIPPAYLTQIVAPWLWYDRDIDRDAALAKLPGGGVSSGTNQVEAHVYFGLIPLALAIVAAIRPGARRRECWFWLAMGVFGLVYATALPLPLFRHLPGFSFFHGPGRYGLLTTVSVALGAAATLQAVLKRLSRPAGVSLASIILLITTAELWWVSGVVTYAVAIPNAPIDYRDASVVRRLLREHPQPVRLFAPGPNVPTLLGVSAVPVYLGIGPAEYYTGDWPPPPSPADPKPGSPYSDEQFAWMRANGVTHVLSFAEIDTARHPVARVWVGFDELLSRAWGRFQEPIFLYELSGALPRTRFEPPDVAAKVEITELRANRVSVHVESPIAGKVVLGDLDYPGWLCQVDGLALGREDGRVMASQRHGMDRAVDVPAGGHEIVWVYQPRSLYYGLVVSLLAATLLLLACVVRVLLARRGHAAASSDAATTIAPKR
jgi:hypothetical protein